MLGSSKDSLLAELQHLGVLFLHYICNFILFLSFFYKAWETEAKFIITWACCDGIKGFIIDGLAGVISVSVWVATKSFFIICKQAPRGQGGGSEFSPLHSQCCPRDTKAFLWPCLGFTCFQQSLIMITFIFLLNNII